MQPQIPSPSLNPSLLQAAAQIFLCADFQKTRKPATRVLDSVLSLCALDQRFDEIDKLQALAQDFPADRFLRLISVLNEMGDSYRSLDDTFACLFAIPVVTNGLPGFTDLSSAAVAAIEASFADLFGEDGGLTALALPWLASGVPYSQNPIARRHLLQQLSEMVEQEERPHKWVAGAGMPERAKPEQPWAKVRDRLRDQEWSSELASEERTVAGLGVRYLCVAVIAKNSDPALRFDRLSMPQDQHQNLSAWLAVVQETLSSQEYGIPRMRGPFLASGAEFRGGLYLAIIEAEHFIASAVAEHGRPENCELSIKATTEAVPGVTAIAIRYSCAGADLGSISVRAPHTDSVSRSRAGVQVAILEIQRFGLKMGITRFALGEPA